MKKKNYFLPVKIFVLVLLIIGGCKKDDSETKTPHSTPSIIASVGSGSWVSLSNRASASIDSGSFHLSGVAQDSTTIDITVTEDVAVGINYHYDPFSSGVGVYGHTSGSPGWTSNHDSCFLQLFLSNQDTVNKKIAGAFHFKAWRATDNSYKHVDGWFDHVPY